MSKQAKPSSSRWIPWLFVGGFLVVFAANGIMITIAVQTWTGLGTERPYERGIHYNDNLAAAREQDRLGWHHDVEIEAQAPQQARLVVALTDAEEKPVFADSVTAHLIRPTHEGFDFEATLDDGGAGRYSATLAFPLSGQWDVQLVARRGGDSYQARQRVLID